MFVRLKFYKRRKSIETTIHELEQEMGEVPGFQMFLKFFPLIDLQVSTKEINAQYQYTLKSVDTESLYKSSELMLQKIKQAPQFSSVRTQTTSTKHQDFTRPLNISAKNIERALSLAFAGANLSPINSPDNEYYAITEVEPKFYHDPTLLSQLYLRSSTGKLVPLNAGTEMNQGVGPLNINLLNGLPAVNVFFNLNNIPLGTAITKLDSIARENLPANVHGQVQGMADIFRSSFSHLYVLVLITFFLIYVILGILYENFFHPLIVMSTLPPATLRGSVNFSHFSSTTFSLCICRPYHAFGYCNEKWDHSYRFCQ